MKIIYFIILISLSVSFNAFAQQSGVKKIYSVGLGVGNENNISNYGIYFTNDFKLYTDDRSGITARMSFFQSTGSFEGEEDYGFRSHSGAFFDFGYFYSIINRDKFNVSFNLGPSVEIGSEIYLDTSSSFEGVKTEDYAKNQLRRIGLFGDLEFSYTPNKKVVHAIGLKSNMFGIYPEFLGVVYKLGFSL